MKISRLFAIGASVFLCLSLLMPGESLSAQSRKSGNEVHKSLKSSAKSSKSEKSAKSAKSSKSAKKKDSVKVASKNRKSAKIASGKTGSRTSAERDVWLRRARSSEALTGKASWYGKDFHNKKTASGLAYDMHTFTAAHRTLPIGTVVKVTDQNNGKSALVCVTDRGPYVKGRIIDLSYAAARRLDLQKRGVGKVELEIVSDENGAPLKKDQAFFVRYPSDSGKNRVGPFHAFADAAAMREALSQAHPDAEVVVEKERRQ